MTSEPQPPTPSEGVPRYFADFILENARQHAELAAQIGELRTDMARQFGELRAEIAHRENRLIKWIIGAMVAFTMAWSGAVYGIVRALTDTLG